MLCCDLYVSASVLDRLNSLLEPNGSLTITERGVIDGQAVTITPHKNFRYKSAVVNMLLSVVCLSILTERKTPNNSIHLVNMYLKISIMLCHPFFNID